MKATSGSHDALAEIGAILATGFANVRARRTAAAERTRNAQEQAQLQASTDFAYIAGPLAAKGPYVVVAKQDAPTEKEAQ